MDFLSLAQFKRLAQTGGIGRDAGAKIALPSAGMRELDAKSKAAVFVFSDQTLDRAGDRIYADGWQLSAYRQNPVVLWAHDAKSLPIGRTTRVWQDGPRLLGRIEFAADISATAREVWALIQGGYLRACSVGFAAIEWKWAQAPDRPLGIDFVTSELLELSIVTVPANRNALVVGAEAPPGGHPRQDDRRRRLELLRLSAP